MYLNSRLIDMFILKKELQKGVTRSHLSYLEQLRFGRGPEAGLGLEEAIQ